VGTFCREAQSFKVGETIGSFGKFYVFPAAYVSGFNFVDRAAKLLGLTTAEITFRNKYIEFALR
jgi:hypothetical protein